MTAIATLAERLVDISGSPEGAAQRVGVSVATISRWRTGRGTPRPKQEQRLRQLVDSVAPEQSVLPMFPAARPLPGQIENVIRSILNEFRETLHRYGRFSHRNDSLDFLAKVLFSHISDRESGGIGLSMGMLKAKEGPARALRAFVEHRLRLALPKSLSYELAELSKTLAISERDDDFAAQVVGIFCKDIVDDALSSVIRSHRLDVLNDIFGRFVTDSFVEEKEMAQYLTPPDVVSMMATIGVSSLSDDLIADLIAADGTHQILDPSCGVGSFLVAGIHAVAQRSKRPKADMEAALQKRVVGIDKSERMVQLAITNLALLGAQETNVILANALSRQQSESFNRLNGRVALILTNPPFGASFSQSEIGSYKMFSPGERDKGRIDSELLFIERYMDWLCDGGVLVAIVPDNILTNQGACKRLRSLIARQCDVLSIISLPHVTFAAAGTTTKTSILHLRKKDAKARSVATYFANCEYIGYQVVTRGGQRRKVIDDKNQLPDITSELLCKSNVGIGKRIQFDPETERWDARYNLSTEVKGKSSSLVKVSEIADLVSDKLDPRRLKAEVFEYIEIADVDARLGMLWSKTTSATDAPSRARKRVRAGDVLMSTVRPERACVAVVPPYLDGAICSTGFAVLRPKGINSYLLAFLLKSPTFIAQVEREMSGIAYPAINEAVIPNLSVKIRPSDKKMHQKTAESYQAAIEKLEQEYRRMLMVAGN